VSIRTGHVSNIFPKSRISRESTNKYLKIYAGRKKVTERKGSATVKNESKRTHPHEGARRSDMLCGFLIKGSHTTG